MLTYTITKVTNVYKISKNSQSSSQTADPESKQHKRSVKYSNNNTLICHLNAFKPYYG